VAGGSASRRLKSRSRQPLRNYKPKTRIKHIGRASKFRIDCSMLPAYHATPWQTLNLPVSFYIAVCPSILSLLFPSSTSRVITVLIGSQCAYLHVMFRHAIVRSGYQASFSTSAMSCRSKALLVSPRFQTPLQFNRVVFERHICRCQGR
jgi:hypothetical protein